MKNVKIQSNRRQRQWLDVVLIYARTAFTPVHMYWSIVCVGMLHCNGNGNDDDDDELSRSFPAVARSVQFSSVGMRVDT